MAKWLRWFDSTTSESRVLRFMSWLHSQAWEGTGDSSSIWVPVTHVGDQHAIPGSWLQPGLRAAVGAIWGLKSLGGKSLILCLPSNKKVECNERKRNTNANVAEHIPGLHTEDHPTPRKAARSSTQTQTVFTGHRTQPGKDSDTDTQP